MLTGDVYERDQEPSKQTRNLVTRPKAEEGCVNHMAHR